MIDLATVRKLERLVARLQAAHEEVSKLAQASPDVEMGDFKRGLVCELIEETATFLGSQSPLNDRAWLKDKKSTYSDAVLALSQYISAVASVRYDNAVYRNEKWYWELESAKKGVPETPYVPLARPKDE